MLFLSPREKQQWAGLGAEVLAGRTTEPHAFDGEIRSNLRPVFAYFVGTLLAAGGQEPRAVTWLQEGAREEETSLLSNT